MNFSEMCLETPKICIIWNYIASLWELFLLTDSE